MLHFSFLISYLLDESFLIHVESLAGNKSQGGLAQA